MELRQQIKQHQISDKENRRAVDQFDATQPARQEAVARYQGEQEKRLARSRITFDLGAALGKNQRLAHCFDDQVGGEQQKQVDREQDRGQSFAGMNFGEQPQAAVE